MAQKLFKGFMQVTEGTFDAENGYIYFVRNTANTGATDGYLQFNGKKYGTAAEAVAALEGKINLPNGYNDIASYIDAQIAAITNAFSSDEVSGSSNGVEVHVGQANGNVTAVTVTAPNFAETYATTGDVHTVSENLTAETAARGELAGRVSDIEADYLTSNDKTALENNISDLQDFDTSADTRMTALEDSAHTHSNKAVLDTIDQAKVNAWDAMAGGAAVVLSAYTGSDAGVTSGMLKSYEIFQGGVSVGKIDIPKDLVVSSGQIVEENGVKYLRLTIANSNTPVDIAVTDLVDVYTAGDGIEISSANTVSAKVVAANGLSVGANGIAMGLADGSNAGAMSAADFTKLGTIDASAQTNVIETVKVNGTALTVTDKTVNVELPDYSGTYAPLSLTGTVSDNRTAFDNYTGSTNDRLDNDEQVFDSYTAATDSRLDAIESGYTQKATYDAYTAATDASIAALSGISANTRLDTLEAVSAGTRLDAIESGYTQKATYDAYTAATDASIAALSGVSADTRISALEALTASTNSALQSISAADASVSVSAKANNAQTVGVAISQTAGNGLSLENDGLFAAVYYDGDDSN